MSDFRKLYGTTALAYFSYHNQDRAYWKRVKRRRMRNKMARNRR